PLGRASAPGGGPLLATVPPVVEGAPVLAILLNGPHARLGAGRPDPVRRFTSWNHARRSGRSDAFHPNRAPSPHPATPVGSFQIAERAQLLEQRLVERPGPPGR